MSVAVAIKKHQQILLATDSLVSFGSGQAEPNNYRSHKVMRLGPHLLASTGWSLYDNLLQDYLSHFDEPPELNNELHIFRFLMQFWKTIKQDYSYVNEQCDDKNSPFADLDAHFLIVNQSGIFVALSNMNVIKFEQYYAIGSGGDYAMGALHALYGHDIEPRMIIHQAVAAAISLDTSCGGEINVFQVPV